MCCGLVIAFLPAGCRSHSLSPVNNVILIVIDTLRADALGCYGGEAHTPNIDRLADEGLRFSRARSHIPITGPSHSSLFTSTWPQEHGFTNNAMQLPERCVTMAQLLQAGGMHTAGFVSLGVLKGKFGFNRGFDHFSDEFGIDWFFSAGEIDEKVARYLDSSPGKPCFLWVHYSDPHEPYQDPDSRCPDVKVMADGEEIAELGADGRHHLLEIPLKGGKATLSFMQGPRALESGDLLTIVNAKLDAPGKIRPDKGMFPWFEDQTRNDFVSALPGKLMVEMEDLHLNSVRVNLVTSLKRSPERSREAYLREVEYVDRRLGDLLEDLRRKGLLEDSLLVLLADHGEGLGDHALPGHIEQLYDSLLHVPLVFWSPGRLPEGVVDDRPVGLVDVLPTIAGLTGIEADPKWRGVDLLADRRTRKSLPLIAATYKPEAKRNLEAIVDGGFKFIRDRDDGSIELYDLSKDPKELKNIAGARPAKATAMEVRMNELLQGVEAPPSKPRVLDEETRDQLRALGYAD